MPAAARAKTEAGARAFVTYFFEQVNLSWTEPRPGAIAALSDPTCEFCKKTDSTARSFAAKKHRFSGPPVTLRSTESITGAPVNQSYVFADLVQNAGSEIDAAGKVVKSAPRSAIPSNVALVWKGGRWWVLGVDVA